MCLAAATAISPALIMTVTTAKVAGCENIVACSPPRPGIGINPAIIYAAHICGADKIMAMGGVQGVAAMTFGLFGLPKANILVGPGNQFVAEAKRILFGRVGIDMFAGPTDSLILAEASADPMIVAADLVGQAEHGYNSPVWLVTDTRSLAEEVMRLVPTLIDALPESTAKMPPPPGATMPRSFSAPTARRWRRHRMPMRPSI
jgi:sulfopropanediol 3-dehydrogenase